MNLVFGAGKFGSTKGTVGDFATNPFVTVTAALERRIGIDINRIPVFENSVFQVAFGDAHGKGELLDLVNHVALAIKREFERVERYLFFFHRARIAFYDTAFDADLLARTLTAIVKGLFGSDRVDCHFPLSNHDIGTCCKFDAALVAFTDTDPFGGIKLINISRADNSGYD